MKIRTLSRHVRQGLLNIFRNGWMSFASISSVAITLLILGVFLLLAMNVNHIAKNVERQVEINVVLKENVNKEQAESVKEKIGAISQVESVIFLSKEDRLEKFRNSFGDKAYLFDGLEQENPLTDEWVVKTKEPKETGLVAEQIKDFDYVESITYAKETVQKLFRVTGLVRNLGIVFIIALSFTAMFLIANTIKLTIFARRKEIEIMKLVGATDAFIRWPFFIEGMLMGAIGSLVPLFLLILGYKYFLNFVRVDLSLYFLNLLPLHPLDVQLAGLLIGIGAFIGIWGSLVSVRRFLKV